jgi:tetratricopeptide (TPR) repeat protein
MGRSEEALPICEQVLAINTKAWGAESSYVATNLLTKARILASLQRYNEALDLFNQSLSIRTKLHHGLEHINVAEVLHYKALCLNHLGQSEQAVELGKKALTIYESKLGVDHPTTINVKNEWI